ncbi:MAG: hypothetical protein JST86_14710 [Bacteroidetes bacterium]|nr:hypothetical protein [Bacteroidota bacterium]
MKMISALSFGMLITFLSCHQAPALHDLSGTYESIEEDNLTKIERISDTEYLIDVPDAKDRIPATRNGNTLSGMFQGIPISTAFNATGDTMTSFENGKAIYESVKITQ